MARDVRTEVAGGCLPQFRRRAEVEALRRRDRRERQRPLLMVLCIALAVAAFTGAGLLREIQSSGPRAEFGRGPNPKQ